MYKRQRDWSRFNSHLVIFRQRLSYRLGEEQLEIIPGTRLVGMLLDGPQPLLQLATVTIAVSADIAEIIPNPDPHLTLEMLAMQSEEAAQAALQADDPGVATDYYLMALAQYRLLEQHDQAEQMLVAAQRCHNLMLRTPEGLAEFDQYTANLSAEALRQLGHTIRALVRQLGGFNYRPVNPEESLLLWESVTYALNQVAARDTWQHNQPQTADPANPEEPWVSLEDLSEGLLSRAETNQAMQIMRADLGLTLDPDAPLGFLRFGQLTEQQGKLEQATYFYQMAVEVAERRLGTAYFDAPDRPIFWLAVETRPYMQAQGALAAILRRQGQLNEAAETYWTMLDLNPGDNQGVRYPLASLLLELGDQTGFARLYRMLATYMADMNDLPRPVDPLDPAYLAQSDGSAAWLYPAALYYFQREGASERTQEVLRLARAQNREIPPLLQGRRRLPDLDPEFYSHGSYEEAVIYVRYGLAGWQKTPGALDWLRTKPIKSTRTLSGQPTSPLSALIDTWIADQHTVQAASTKKVYRKTLDQLVIWLTKQRGQSAQLADLTAEQIEAFLATPAMHNKRNAHNHVRLWCAWLVQRKELAHNPIE
ncbi:MAG: hypothetical protein AB4911_06485 [Oscillochloridaceae bacterium umkhey_bin13]